MQQARILIVEDEIDQAEALRLKLLRLGYEVVGCETDGEQAVATVSAVRPDLVLMDIVLPGHLDGIQAAQIIRDRYLIPVVYLTAYSDEETLERAKLTDPFGYLIKPPTPRELHATIHIALSRSTTDREMREAARTNAILMSMCDAIIMVDPQGQLRRINAAAERMLGKPAAAVLGEKLWNLCQLEEHGERLDLAGTISGLSAGGPPRQCENQVELIARDGRRVPVHYTMSAVREPGGHLHGVVLLLHDDAERRQAEQRLVESEEKFRTLAENTDVAIFVYRDRLLYFNAKALELSGYDAQTLGSKSLLDLVHPDDRDYIAQRLNMRLAGDYQPQRYEIRILTPGGETRWMDIAAGLIPYEGGHAGIATAFDITERKQQAAQLLRLNSTLQTMTACNEALMRAGDEETLIAEVCRILAERGFPLAWVGIPEQDAARSVRPVAPAGRSAEYVRDIRVSWADDGHGRGPTGTAIRERRVCVMRDIESNAAFSPWRTAARKYGFCCSVALPLVVEDKVIGALNLYSESTEAFDQQELDILEKLAGDLAFGIQALRLRAAAAHNQVERNAAEERYRRTVEHSFEMIAIIQDERFVEINKAGLHLLGAGTDDAIVGHPVTDFLPAEMQGFVRSRIRGVIEEGRPAPMQEAQFRRLDGGLTDVEVAGIQIQHLGLPAVQIVVRDITARKRADSARRRQQLGLERLDHWMRALLEMPRKYTVFYQLVCEAVQDLVTANTAALPLLDKSGDSFSYVAAVGIKADLLKNQSMSLDNGGLCGWVARHADPLLVPDLYRDDRVIPELAKALGAGTALVVPLFSEERIIGGLSAFRAEPPFDEMDLEVLNLFAQRVSVALDNLKLLHTLEERVRERTLELEAINHELEAFAYSVSHDLRAPLRSIDGFCKALVEDCGEGMSVECRDHLHRVRGASQRMGQLIDDMLLLSRVTRAEMRREKVNLSALAESIIAQLREEQPERQAQVDIMPDLVVKGDARLLRVVLDNLLGNAWKFTGDTPSPRISFERIELDHRPVFRVRDNGAGFDMKYVHKLFTPFQRLHGMHEFEGTGIGLATVHRIVQRHGGKVWAEGVPDVGASFFFTLPG